MRKILGVVAVMATGCGVPMTADGGVARLVSIRQVERVLTSRGIEVGSSDAQVKWWSDQGKVGAVAEDVDRFQVFEVPEGPALFELSRNRYLYTAKERLEPCDSALIGGSAVPDAGVQVNVTLSQAAVPGDVLDVVTSHQPWESQDLNFEPAGTTIDELKSWRGRRTLTGEVTVLHRVLGPPFGDFDRTTIVGVLDAGILDQLQEPIVSVQGTFEPVAPGAQLDIAWDTTSLDPLLQGQSVVRFAKYTALRQGLPLATLHTWRHTDTTVPLLMPAIDADSFTVRGAILTQLGPGELGYADFSWHGPLGASPEMKLRHLPPRGVEIAPDAHAVAWLPPAIAPGAYMVRLLKPEPGNTPSHFAFQILAVIITDETLVPLPPELRTPGMFAVVDAIAGEGVSADGCVSHLGRLPSWSRIPGVSQLWNP